MRRLFTDAEEAQIARFYLTGFTTSTLATKYETDKSVICKALQRQGVTRRRGAEAAACLRKFTDAQDKAIGKRYLFGESMMELAFDLGVSQKAIMNALKRLSIRPRPKSSYRKYHCDHSFFDQIDSEEKAYWLGFLAADGSTEPERNCVRLNLQRLDRSHLRKFLNAIQATYPIYDWDRQGHLSSAISISSRRMVGALRKYGIVSHRKPALRWPKIRPDLMRHFLRGYVDGDGDWGYRSLKQRPQPYFRCCGNHAFLRSMQKFVMSHCALSRVDLYRTQRTPWLFNLIYSGSSQVPELAELLYRASTISLLRKQKIALTIRKYKATRPRKNRRIRT